MRFPTDNHNAFFYTQQQQLAEAVFEHICPAIEIGAKIVVVMRPANWERVKEQFLKHDLDPDVFSEARVLTQLDAYQCLELISRGGVPDEFLFRQHVGAVMKAASLPGTIVHAYGEMVDILCANGKFDAAIELEQMWNRLREHYDFTLLCGYDARVIKDDSPDSFLQKVCCMHDFSNRVGVPGAV